MPCKSGDRRHDPNESINNKDVFKKHKLLHEQSLQQELLAMILRIELLKQVFATYLTANHGANG